MKNNQALLVVLIRFNYDSW